jgi:hypothetical protein
VADVIRVPEGFGDGGDALVLSPSGSLVAVWVAEQGDNRGTVTVYRVADGQRVAGPERVGDSRGAVFIDDATLLIASENKCLRWPVPGRPKVLATFRGAFIRALGARPGVPVFALGTFDEGLVVCELATGKRRFSSLGPYELDALMPTFSRDGRLLASRLYSRDYEDAIMVWEVATGRRLQMHLPLIEVRALEYAPDNETLFALDPVEGGRPVVLVYRVGGVDPERTVTAPKFGRSPVILRNTSDGLGLVLLAPDGDWCRVNGVTGARESGAKAPVLLEPDYGTATLSANGRVLAGVAEDFTITVWPLDDGNQKKPARKAKK